MKKAPRRPRTVGLDKPCRKCGRPIHHTYVGPEPGVCGRCTDRRRSKRVHTRRVSLHPVGHAPKRRSAAASAALVVLTMVGGAAALIVALQFFFG